MKRKQSTRRVGLASVLQLCMVGVLATAGCGDSSKSTQTKVAQKTEEVKASAVEPEGHEALAFEIAKEGGKVRFEMEAPMERQDGVVPESAVRGEVFFDLKDLSKSTGLINVDIAELEIFQQKAKEAGAYGEREKSELQNEHMRGWLEIGPDAPEEERTKNSLVQFEMKSISSSSVQDVSAMQGAARVVRFEALGEFRLHQRSSTKTVELEAEFHYEEDAPVSVHVKSVKPFVVDLDEHGVRPRTAFGMLAKKGLAAMSPKVGKDVQVSVDFLATIKEKPSARKKAH